MLGTNHTYPHQHHGHASIRRSLTPLVLTTTPSPGPSDGLMTPVRLAHNYPVNLKCCHPGTTQGHLCPWCMDPNRTGGRGMRRNMFLWWILLFLSQGFVFRKVQGELPFMAGNNAAMLVNWWVGTITVFASNCVAWRVSRQIKYFKAYFSLQALQVPTNCR